LATIHQRYRQIDSERDRQTDRYDRLRSHSAG